VKKVSGCTERSLAQGGCITTQQIILLSCAYLVELAVVLYFTRATAWRVVGALTGGAVGALLALGAIALCEALGWWRVPFASTPYFLPLFFLGLLISLTPIYLVTWRIARRFGWRGLAVFLCVVAVIGPPRDYLIAASFPKWMVFAPGLIPILADAATYVGMVALGHAVMRLMSGPAREDQLARQPMDAAKQFVGPERG
jgi:hypothetical protein